MTRHRLDVWLDPDTGDLPEVTRLTSGLELIEQRIRLVLRRGVGEWFLDPSVGLPLLAWFEGKPRPETLLRRVQEEIRRIPGVLGTDGWTVTVGPVVGRFRLGGQVFYDEGGVVGVAAVGDVPGLGRNTSTFGVFFSHASPVPIVGPVIGRG